MPLEGSGVFHPRWDAYHRPTATSAMRATCDITRNTGSGVTQADGTYVPSGTSMIYTGPCRVTPRLRPVPALAVGEAQEFHQGFNVSVSYDTPEILAGDLVDITSADDTGLVGRKLRVLTVDYATEQWQRNLICDERES